MDFDRALLLLNVVDKALGHPQLRSIVTAASDELNEMANPKKDEPAKAEAEVKMGPSSEPEVDGSQPDSSNKPTAGRRL